MNDFYNTSVIVNPYTLLGLEKITAILASWYWSCIFKLNIFDERLQVIDIRNNTKNANYVDDVNSLRVIHPIEYGGINDFVNEKISLFDSLKSCFRCGKSLLQEYQSGIDYVNQAYKISCSKCSAYIILGKNTFTIAPEVVEEYLFKNYGRYYLNIKLN